MSHRHTTHLGRLLGIVGILKKSDQVAFSHLRSTCFMDEDVIGCWAKNAAENSSIDGRAFLGTPQASTKGKGVCKIMGNQCWVRGVMSAL